MSNWGLDFLRRKINLEGEIELTSGLHIGVGGSLEAVGTDSPVIKDFNGRPYIPGSSFKGSFRAIIEAIVRGGEFPKDKLWCCNIMGNDEEKCIHRKEDNYISQNGEEKKATASDVEDFIWEKSCHICRLLGSPHIASRVKFPDMPVLGDWDTTMYEVRNGVAIDRDSETAKSGALYDFEVVPPGTRFKFDMLIENPEDWELGLLFMGLGLFNKGYAYLGGIKSRGLGTMKINFNIITCETPKSLLGEEKPEIIKEKQNIQKKAEEYKKALKDYIKGGGKDVQKSI
ncbi:MAG: type III CRISPR-associated RAMP protein Csx7 [Candidatus Heimdallarchaeaceae archaeon]